MNIDICIDEFCAHLSAEGRSPRTIDTYAYHLSKLHVMGEIEGVTVQRLEKLMSMVRSGIADATYAGHVQAIKSFFAWAVKHDYIRVNPAGGMRRPPKQLLTGVSKAMRQEDLERMIALANERNCALDYALLMMLGDTGMRAGELRNLNLCDINIVRCEAVVYGKTGIGTVDFTDETSDALLAWISVRPHTHPDAVFTTQFGRISVETIYGRLERLGHELGIDRHNPHAIRHLVGQGWIDRGANLEVVRQKLRHKDISTTAMIYGNQDRARIKAASRKYSLVRHIAL